ncbi:MFS transporter [Cryptosporangium japonicum]|uniref:MFS transporter n=1 Tax=Cryptosporangium japonicum TaxID=80872 RepID=A0ABN0TIQ3_9ACTN
MPRSIYVLAAGIFAMVTSEFVVAGLMPQLSAGLDTGIAQIGYLVTVFAVSMAVGGPVLVLRLRRVAPKRALLIVLTIFFAGNLLAALAPTYWTMIVARIVTGAASQAFFGIAISLCVRAVAPEVRGRAVGVVMTGLMVGTLLGLPFATVVGERFGWRAAFWAIAVLTAIAGVLTIEFVPDPDAAPESGAAGASVFRRPRLILALVSSTLIIGATFSAFSFVAPILTGVTGFAPGTVPLLLLAYGAATVIGNFVVGRLADRRTIPTLLVGTALNAVFLAGLAVFTGSKPLALGFLLGVGLVGVTMNPAMVTRVHRAGNTGPLVNTVHSSFITTGIVLGSAIGASVIDGFGLRAPLVVGVILAVLAVATILPEIRVGTAARRPEHHPATRHFCQYRPKGAVTCNGAARRVGGISDEEEP